MFYGLFPGFLILFFAFPSFSRSWAGKPWDPTVFGAPGLPGFPSPAVGGPEPWDHKAPLSPLSGGRGLEPWDPMFFDVFFVFFLSFLFFFLLI